MKFFASAIALMFALSNGLKLTVHQDQEDAQVTNEDCNQYESCAYDESICEKWQNADKTGVCMTKDEKKQLLNTLRSLSEEQLPCLLNDQCGEGEQCIQVDIDEAYCITQSHYHQLVTRVLSKKN